MYNIAHTYTYYIGMVDPWFKASLFFPWFLSASLIPDVQLALVLLRRRIRSVDLHLRCRMWPAAGSRP